MDDEILFEEDNLIYEDELIYEDDDYSNMNTDEALVEKAQVVQNYKDKLDKIDFTQPIIAFFGIIVIICIMIVSPFFHIQEIEIVNGDRFNLSEVKSITGVKEGKNIILLNSKKIESKLEESIYIADANVVKKIPSSLEIELYERRVRGYVPYMGSYLYIDEEGRVLETQSTYYDPLPEVIGLKFSQFKLGEVLEVENPEALDIVLQMSQMVQKYELLDLTLRIDVSNISNILLYINQVEVYLGNMIDIDQKIRIIAEVIKTIPEEDRGTLDLSDLTKPIIFQYLI